VTDHQRGQVLTSFDQKFGRDRFGQLRTNPACAVERDAAIRAARMWRDLDLDREAAPAPMQLRRRRK
jgi:hypothetical protein